MGGSDLTFFALLAPLVAGVLVGGFRPDGMVAFVNNASGWWERRYQHAKATRGWIRGGVWRWLIWGFHKLDGWTDAITDDAARAGTRLTMFFYVGALSLFLVASAIYIALALLMIVVGFWILGKVLEANDGGRSSTTRAFTSALRGGQSRDRRDMWGDDYVEVLDDHGRRVGTSRTKKDMWGEEYVEHLDESGARVATSKIKKDMWGDSYEERRSNDGEVEQTSRVKKDMWGDEFVEHRDSDGSKVGESRDRRDLWGDRYTEHKPKD